MLKKILSLLIVIIFIFSAGVFACDDIFINYPKSHIVGRVMDFSVNVANDTVFAFIGQKNITDIVIDAERIPESQLANWTIKYGYWGRGVFGTPIVDDAMNTEGLSISGLYLEGITNYPVYNNNDKRPVL